MSDDWHPWQKLKLTDPFECPADWARGWGGRHRPWIRSWCHVCEYKNAKECDSSLPFDPFRDDRIVSLSFCFPTNNWHYHVILLYIIVIVYRHRRGYNFELAVRVAMCDGQLLFRQYKSERHFDTWRNMFKRYRRRPFFFFGSLMFILHNKLHIPT